MNNSHGLLHAVAHFDVRVNRPEADKTNLQRHFDVEQFRQVDEAPLVFLPPKQKAARTYYKPPREVTAAPGAGRLYQFYGFIFDDKDIDLPAKK